MLEEKLAKRFGCSVEKLQKEHWYNELHIYCRLMYEKGMSAKQIVKIIRKDCPEYFRRVEK